ncbi:MAG: ATP-binding protein [Magnetovibrio sp.]|nr:ATP-binding protein [Magnetovibrio sp.]
MAADPASLALLYCATLPDNVAVFAQSNGMTTTQVSVDDADDNAGESAQNTNVFVISDVTEHRLDRVLLPNVDACVEATPNFCGMDEDVLGRINDSDIFISLTTASAYSNELALHFYRWVAAKIKLNDDLAGNLELALQEALANGLIHGNMGLNKTLPDSFHDLESYSETVHEKLESEDAGQKRIEVWGKWDDKELAISILDHGAGFDVNAPVEKSVTGWGLNLIRHLAKDIAITDNGCKMTMRFER